MKYVELSVLVPEERIGDFYAFLGSLAAGSPSATAVTRASDGPAAESSAARRPRSRGASRYAGIAGFLENQNGDPEVIASFEELEEVIGSNLPASALRHRAWWANSERNTHARMWLEQGWRVASVDLSERKVQFARN